MSKDDLTRMQLKALQHIYDYVMQHEDFPSNHWLKEKLLVESSRVSVLKSDLRKLGFLEGKYSSAKLTPEAINFLENNSITNSNIVRSSYIPLLGEVSAGKGIPHEDFAVYIEDLNEAENAAKVAIPQLNKSKNVMALKVNGISMEAAGIMNGDYVIIEPIEEMWGIREGEIIVGSYIEDNNDYEDFNPQEMGFTLKVYRGEVTDKNNQKYYRLGIMKDYGKQNPFEIKAKVLRPMGKVIGVYRAL